MQGRVLETEKEDMALLLRGPAKTTQADRVIIMGAGSGGGGARGAQAPPPPSFLDWGGTGGTKKWYQHLR